MVDEVYIFFGGTHYLLFPNDAGLGHPEFGYDVVILLKKIGKRERNFCKMDYYTVNCVILRAFCSLLDILKHDMEMDI